MTTTLASLLTQYQNDPNASLERLLNQTPTLAASTHGVVYTPWAVAWNMTLLAKPQPHWNIIDPACGHGVFLFTLLHYAHQHFCFTGVALHSWFCSHVQAFDISASALHDLRLLLCAYFQRTHQLSLLPQDFPNIHCSSALDHVPDHPYDLCLGNPPYIRARDLPKAQLQTLKTRFKTCKTGTIDLFFAFIEHFLTHANRLVFVTPNSFFKTRSGLSLTTQLVPTLETLVDFGATQLFPGASVHTCVFVADQRTRSHGSFIQSRGFDDSGTQQLKTTLLPQTKSTQHFPIVYSGVATLADRFYKVQRDDNGFYALYQSERYPLEPTFLAPFFKWTKDDAQSIANPTTFMIYPYDAQRQLIPEETLRNQAPQTYAYLQAIAPVLRARDKGDTHGYPAWYAYGRFQGIHRFESPNAVVIPQMLSSTLRPFRVDFTPLLQRHSTILFTSGYVVPAIEPQAQHLDHLLSPAFLHYAQTHGRPWTGKTESYYSLSSPQIKTFAPTTPSALEDPVL